MRKVFAVILASGTGQRMGAGVPKQFLPLAGRTILEHALDAFEASAHVDEMILVAHPDTEEQTQHILRRNRYSKLRRVVPGGETRQQSSKAGIDAIAEEDAWVLIHDAARPLVSEAVIARCVCALNQHQAVSAAVPATDTVFEVNDTGRIDAIPDRTRLWRAQTPQAFHLQVLRRAHQLALATQDSGPASDDCSLVLRFQLAPVHVVEGDVRNLKVTYPADLALAERLLTLQ
ncbi:2-C-methyl-D-erythritol 4-phosphate cytidylyltransferase [Alicyclobacillus kakegawensis]|uniref:2-C-methyl-D-erythritol 4-phosphate cytidylyltransferase n=1 Tax=Alicyclobacillus kakegawensis TaxID=392012 RepID=UPI00082E891D|nr:2-C-methyl-D-erythritol 4-phosphate cytidylyltransferase [Alicyclobacillus kakegawensis]